MKKIAFMIVIMLMLVTCAMADRWILDEHSFTTNELSIVLDGRFADPTMLKSVVLYPVVSTNECTTSISVVTPGKPYAFDVATAVFTNSAYRISGLDLILIRGQTLVITNTFSTGSAVLEFQME